MTTALAMLREAAAGGPERVGDAGAPAGEDAGRAGGSARLAPWVVALAQLVVTELGISPAAVGAPLLLGALGEPAPLPPPVRDALVAAIRIEGADLLGQAHEALLAPGDRRRHGAFYTPRSVAEGLLAAAAGGWWSASSSPRRICDPACGGGAFLLAAARWGRSVGVPVRQLVEDDLVGIDLDPLTAAVADATLRIWAAAQGEPVAATRIVAGDALASGRAWCLRGHGVDLVVGNPPFQNQLGTATARSAEDHADLRQRLGDVARGYADTSSLFLGAALAQVGSGGRVALLLPESFLSARDARGARAALVERADLVGLWVAGGSLFDASVRVVGVVAERHAPDGPQAAAPAPAPVARWVGPDRRAVAPCPAGAHDLGEGTWGVLVADLAGVPAVDLQGGGRLADLATATAGFRHQFYGLAPFVVEADPGVPGAPVGGGAPAGPGGPPGRDGAGLVVSGLIDPANLRWGRHPARFARQTWARPVVDLAALADADAGLARWGRARLRPKVLVATQTRVIEAAVDEDGRWWPSVPVISVEPFDVADLWRLAAVLLAPPVSAWARARFPGSALSAEAVKLAARQVHEVPLPPGGDAWARGAHAVRAATTAAQAGDAEGWRASLLEVGTSMCEAYGAGGEVLAWWAHQLPPLR